MKINFSDKIPIYIQIMNYIKENIVNESLKLGDKLPSVREFSKVLMVNPNTMQRAYQELEREGVIYTQRGMGSFIKEDMNMVKKLKRHMSLEIVNNFLDGMKKIGFNEKEIIDIIKGQLEKEDI
ncbi:GntR family transcriptional regulator [Clostridium niameyense]|uniref:GntR family transcriptional regulator n=1 Tax=Clostridium niameyense TaxID=1622073 RepID=A0A6M0RDX3_9CLOT|nr:GntR family transcriptional regulator [Clostridium niameyense]NEZ47538.1 GntR family transcriptional regulator [Clostridium niameyense]